MIYLGYFRDVTDNETLYRVEINCKDTEEGQREITLADNPVTISMVTGDNTVYKPYKCSNATIRILMDGYNFDLNNAFSNKVAVKIYREDKIIWTGFATPNAYTQDFNTYYNVFELECQDAISTLQYYNYTKKDEKDLIPKADNFINIIARALSFLDYPYTSIFVSDTIKVVGASDLSVLDALFISPNNFIDEDGEAWNYLQILEEICRITGLTAVPHEDRLYFINTDAIARGMNDYYMYSLANNMLHPSFKATVRESYNVGIDTINREGTSITLDSIYNKVKVKDDLYPVENQLPNIYDDTEHYIPTDTDDQTNGKGIEGISYMKDNKPYFAWSLDDPKIDNDDKDVLIHSANEGLTVLRSRIDNNKEWHFMRYYGYENSDFKDTQVSLYRYNVPTGIEEHQLNATGSEYVYYIVGDIEPLSGYTDYNYTTTKNTVGSMICDHAKITVDDWFKKSITTPKYTTSILLYQGFTGMEDGKVPVKYYNYDGSYSATRMDNLDDIPADKVIYSGTTEEPPLFKAVSDYVPLRADSIIKISGDFTYFPWRSQMLPAQTDTDHKMTDEYSYVKMSVSCGNKRWNGSEWITGNDPIIFNVPLEYQKDKDAYYNPIAISDNKYMNNIDTGGYNIPSPTKTRWQDMYGTENVSVEKIDVRIYRLQAPTENGNLAPFTLLDNFKVSVYTGKSKMEDDKEEKDTLYENDINRNAIDEYSQITCKICSWDNKKPNYSHIFYIYYRDNENVSASGGLSYLGASGTDSSRIYYSLRDETSDILTFRSAKYLYNMAKGYFFRPEEQIISNIVEQYNTPTLRIDCNLNINKALTPYTLYTYNTQFPDYTFVLDSVDYDLYENNAKVSLVSKKTQYRDEQH